jgi:hypothetical protein
MLFFHALLYGWNPGDYTNTFHSHSRVPQCQAFGSASLTGYGPAASAATNREGQHAQVEPLTVRISPIHLFDLPLFSRVTTIYFRCEVRNFLFSLPFSHTFVLLLVPVSELRRCGYTVCSNAPTYYTVSAPIGLEFPSPAR